VSKGGVSYAFLKDIGNTGSIEINERDLSDISTAVPFAFAPKQIAHPVDAPPSTVPAGTANSVITVDHKVDISLSAAEFTLMKKAYKSYYGEDLNVLSEIGLVHGIPAGADVKAAQLATVSSELIDLNNVSAYNGTILIGTQDALFIS
jgi:hypothetical protein